MQICFEQEKGSFRKLLLPFPTNLLPIWFRHLIPDGQMGRQVEFCYITYDSFILHLALDPKAWTTVFVFMSYVESVFFFWPISKHKDEKISIHWQYEMANQGTEKEIRKTVISHCTIYQNV
jgi:hypothetical protein